MSDADRRTITLCGIEFPADEVQIVTIDGQPEWVVNLHGARRLAQYAPDPRVGAEFLAAIDRLDETKGGNRHD